ncbi:hypothetical protein Y032_1277g3800 [Ancylostoma ceylanicum]|nr:hypothetical protein Y032_1277g3800 [Ancylostoma ceylanicum]
MGAIAWATSFSIRIDCRRYAPGDCPSIIVGVDSGDPSAASKSTRRDCAARAGVPSRTTKYGVFLTATQTLMGAMSSHQRHTLEKFLKGELKCNPLQIGDSIALLIKQ